MVLLSGLELYYRTLPDEEYDLPHQDRWVEYGLRLRKPFFVVRRIDGKAEVSHDTICGLTETQSFPLEKRPGVCRVLVIGESGAFLLGRTLRGLAAERAPEATEVVNAGVSAAGIEILSRVFSESIDLKPDVVVVYIGHNIRVVHPAFSRRYHLYRIIGSLGTRSRLFRRIYARLPIQGPSNARSDEERRRLFGVFLDDLARETRKRSIPVVLCTMPGNLMFPPDSNESTIVASDYLEALYQYCLGPSDRAMKTLRDKLESAPSPVGYFLLGNWMYEQHRYGEARDCYQRAVDIDGDRSQMMVQSSELDALRGAAARHGFALLDFDRELSEKADHRIPGWDILYDHCHVWETYQEYEALRCLTEINRRGWGGANGEGTVRSARNEWIERIPDWGPYRGQDKTDWNRTISYLAALLRKGETRRMIEKHVEEVRAQFGRDLPRRARYDHLVGRAYDEAGDLSQALRFMRNAQEADPLWVDPYLWEGLYQLKAHRRGDARKAFDRAYALAPSREDCEFFHRRLDQ